MILAAGCEARGEFFNPRASCAPFVLPVVQTMGRLEQQAAGKPRLWL